MKRLFGITFLASIVTQPVFAFTPFVVNEIRLEGLQRISVGAVFNYLPVQVGDEINKELSAKAIRALYKTGFFKDVRLEQDGETLVVFVAERPAISEITFTGNDQITSDQLTESLKQIGLSKGKVLDRSLLDKVKLELQRQYYSLGKYGVTIESKTTPLERNRIKVEIEISEGDDAKVYSVNIIGNKVFPESKLISRLQLADISMFTGRNQYSKQLLAADLELLKSYYLDRGYINFNIDSTQVSLTPDKQDVYVTVNISEGDKFTVRSVKLAGELIYTEEELLPLISLSEGDVFSRKETVDTTKRISDKLAEKGYAFANVNIVPDIDKDTRTVGLTLFVDPGRRVYVRRINISGNAKTKDRVIRREFRQMEGDWMSTKSVSQSRTRLDRTGYFEQVNVETPSVAGTSDQVDINYSVTERPTGNLTAGLGYSDTQGLLFNFGVTQENFLGTGKRIGLNIDNSQVTKKISVNYFDPYFTIDGLSQGYSVFYTNVDAAEANISNYTFDSYGANIVHAIPLSEIDRESATVGYEHTELEIGNDQVSQDILDVVAENGSVYDTFPLKATWTRDSRNKRILANSGALTTVGTEVTLPGGNLSYYKVNVRHLQYFPIGKFTTLSTNLTLGYGDSYGDTSRLPPYKNYFAGGSRTIRGFESNSLGPRDEKFPDQSIGGQKQFIGNVELIIPNPLVEDEGSTRLAAFLDAGNVFAQYETVSLSELRYSVGLGLIWLSPVGAMRFSYAVPLNEQEGDKIQAFQFTLGSAF
jgi:outer membrane protein insertion porin family